MDKLYFDQYKRPRLRSALTLEERSELISYLSDDQIDLINKTRRYNAISIFAQNNISDSYNWQLVDYLESTNYKGQGIGDRLYCECGRELRFQYIVESTNNNNKKLGFDHFIELTNLDVQVARQIQLNINNLNLKVDEILLLKKHKYSFPEKQYSRYCVAIITIKKIDSDFYINATLMTRLEEFSRAQLPILFADFEDMERVINKAEKIDKSKHSNPVMKHGSDSLEKEITKNNFVNPTSLSTEELKMYNELVQKKSKFKDVSEKKNKFKDIQKKKNDSKSYLVSGTFSKNSLKDAAYFKLKTGESIVNAKEDGFINVDKKEKISEEELFRLALTIEDESNNLVASREITTTQFSCYRKSKKPSLINKPNSIMSEMELVREGYFISTFNKNTYVNLGDGNWVNVYTLYPIPLSRLYKDIRNVITFDNIMIAKRKTPKLDFIRITPRRIKKRQNK